MTISGIYFVRIKPLEFYIRSQLGCHFYHSDFHHLRQDQIITKWYQGVNLPIFIVTAALSAGLDYPSIFIILHIDAPGRLVEYIQIVSIADRDGLPAVCIISLVSEWEVSQNFGY